MGETKKFEIVRLFWERKFFFLDDIRNKLKVMLICACPISQRFSGWTKLEIEIRVFDLNNRNNGKKRNPLSNNSISM